MRHCPTCGRETPDGAFCVRCGNALEGHDRRGFAAAPHERRGVPRIVSSLYPQLPRASMRAFQVSLLAGVAVVLGLAVAGLYPVALMAAAALVPITTVLYVLDVDLYEDEPARVLGLTILWGLLAGVAVGALSRAIAPDVVVVEETSRLVPDGVLIPLVGGALALAGPLVLLPYRRFNDVLDGATFGSAAGAVGAGAFTITTSLHLLDAGLRPVGALWPWIFRLLTDGVALPVLLAGALGGACGALWLRYRAPVADRSALGALGSPVLAIGAAGLLVVAYACLRILLDPGPALLTSTALALVAVLWLRSVIHLGLLEEAGEIEIGPTVRCPNCHAETRLHSFCGTCGVSMRALPKQRATPADDETEEA